MSFQLPLADRNCYHCTRYDLCYLRRRVDDALRDGIGMLNINDPDVAPRGFQTVFESLAMACVQFERSPHDVKEPVEGELAKQLNASLERAKKAVDNYNIVLDGGESNGSAG